MYDHFVQLEAVTPGEYKSGGTGLTIEYGVHASPFGEIFIAITPRGICKLVFVQQHDTADDIAQLAKRWPQAQLSENAAATQSIINRLFSFKNQPHSPLSLHVTGTNFQVSVWRALLSIAPATVTSYSAIADTIGRPKSARAVGMAVGANPVALLIPCHRVIQQRGHIGGYHWGIARKHAIHAWETAHTELP